MDFYIQLTQFFGFMAIDPRICLKMVKYAIFSTFWVSDGKNYPKVPVYPENFGTENLAHFFMLFYIYCYNAISFCDFKTHSDPPGAPLGPLGAPLTPVCHPEP